MGQAAGFADSPGSDLQGLSEADAAGRLRRDGPNELPQAGRRSIPRVMADVVLEPMFALLIGAGLLYLVLGDPAEAALLFAFASLSVLIAVVQEVRTERALDALRNLSSPRALVIRGGTRRRIPGREVVRGDLLVLAEGDRVPADAVLARAEALEADESMLTGESVPVRKAARVGAGRADTPDGELRPGGDDLPLVFSGTLLVRGQGLARVTAIGAATELGRIGSALGGIEREPPRLRAQTTRLVRILAIVGIAISLLAALLYGLALGDWQRAALGGIALAMSMLPEEIPLILTVFTVMGARRIARVGVLTRRAAAIEALGAATVLCTDKTGTLTQNRMGVRNAGPGGPVRGPYRGRAARRTSDLVEVGILRQAAGLGPGKAFLAGRFCASYPAAGLAQPAMGRVWAGGGAKPPRCCQCEGRARGGRATRAVCRTAAAAAAAGRWPATWRRVGSACWGSPARHSTARQAPRRPSGTISSFAFAGLVGSCRSAPPVGPGRRYTNAARPDPRRDDHRRLPGHGARRIAARPACRRTGHHAAPNWPGWTKPPSAPGCGRRRSSPASCPSRSCASSRPSRPTVRLWR